MLLSILFSVFAVVSNVIDGNTDEVDDIIDGILKKVPLIDGHNDLPYQIYKRKRNKLNDLDLNNWPEVHTDIKRLRIGKVGAQIWSIYAHCETSYKDAVRSYLDQVDVVYRFTEKYPDVFQIARSSQEIMDIFKSGKIASLLGAEGGHSLDSSLATLRMFYQLGVRYLTLTHNCDTPWATCNLYNESKSKGLSEFGKDIVIEMNRLGMMVDLSHVSKASMLDALNTSKAPVIFSHSNAYSITPHTRNVPDDVLLKLKQNKGLIMVTFPSHFLNSVNQATIADVAKHIEYIKNFIGIDHVGIGSDFDGTKSLPVGLEDVSKFPDLLKYLITKNKWTEPMLLKLTGENFLRVFNDVEKISITFQSQMKPLETRLTDSDLINTQCRNVID